MMRSLHAAFAMAGLPLQVAWVLGIAAWASSAAAWFLGSGRDPKHRFPLASRTLLASMGGASVLALLQREDPTLASLLGSPGGAFLAFACMVAGLAIWEGWSHRFRGLEFPALCILVPALTLALFHPEPGSMDPVPFGSAASPLLELAGYACLTHASILGVLALWKTQEARESPDPGKAHLTWARAGFLLLAAGLALGWLSILQTGDRPRLPLDPEGTFALGAALAYAAVLHLHHLPSTKGRRAIAAGAAAWGILAAAGLWSGSMHATDGSQPPPLHRPAP